jgi:hypothetical protein
MRVSRIRISSYAGDEITVYMNIKGSDCNWCSITNYLDFRQFAGDRGFYTSEGFYLKRISAMAVENGLKYIKKQSQNGMYPTELTQYHILTVKQSIRYAIRIIKHELKRLYTQCKACCLFK